MHICLLPVEVLLDTFAFIDPGPDFKSTVAVLARTCRKFKEPALDILWKDVSGFKPLFLCLPGGVRGRVIRQKQRKLVS